MAKQGQGLELLGTILAVAGWSLAAVVLFLFVASLGGLRGAAEGGIVLLSLVSSLIACAALAGLGHLLRAVAQLGRNVHAIGRLLQQERQEN